MATLTNLALAPFGLLYRLACVRPWVTIGVSAAAGLLAHLIGHDGWTALFVCVLAYMLIWVDEAENPPAPAVESFEE